MSKRLVVRNGAPPCFARVDVEGDGLPVIAGFRWSVDAGSDLPDVTVRWDGMTTDLDVEADVANSQEWGVGRVRVECRSGIARKTVVTDVSTGHPVWISAVVVEFDFERKGFVAHLTSPGPDVVA